MEYEFNATQTLALKKIFILFRHISTNLQIVASENGLNLYALNGSNSAWLHIQLGKGFFRRIECRKINESESRNQLKAKHWVVATKSLCQALSIITSSGSKNKIYTTVFLKDIGKSEDNTVRTAVALEKLILREEVEHVNLLSFILNCAGGRIQRSTSIFFEECTLSVPDDLRWSSWHYLRIQPTVLYKSISAYWSPFDDISISYDEENDDISLTVVKSAIGIAAKTKDKHKIVSGVSGKITINSDHFQKLELDENISYPKNITVSLRELLSLTSFCESVKTPLALVLRNPGDPVIALFGKAVDVAESTKDQLNIHKIVATASSQSNVEVDSNILKDYLQAWSGSLWLSSVQDFETQLYLKEEIQNKKRSEGASIRELDIFCEGIDECVEGSIKDLAECSTKSHTTLTVAEHDLIYQTLALDFVQGENIISQKTAK